MAKLFLNEIEKENLSKYNFVYISIDKLKYRDIQIRLHKNSLLLSKIMKSKKEINKNYTLKRCLESKNVKFVKE